MRYAVFTDNSAWTEQNKCSRFKYWTGDFTKSGSPQMSTKIQSVMKFKTARQAYETAGAFKQLWGYRVKAL